jgi:glycolate oxidase
MPSFPDLPEQFLGLARELEPDELSVEPSILSAHAGDKWFASHAPEVVALPKNTASVSRILAFASKHRIPVTPRGAGYGYVGGCVPSKGGISLSLMRLNQILEISPDDFVGVVQPGVITAEFQAAAEARGLYYPPDPASRADCSIGGNIATNAGGPRCLKYGVTRDYVLGLEVVVADGTIIRLGGRCHKNKTGFDLHRLFVGSEGLLGVVTEATLKLLPLPPSRAGLAVGLRGMADAAKVIRAIFASGFLPSALEVADAFTLAAARRRTGSQQLEGCEAHLIVELDGQDSSVRREIVSLRKVVKRAAPSVFIQTALGSDACESFWKLRREFSFALRDTGLTKLNEDIVVPRGRLEELFRFTAGLQERHQLQLACFGHAGDGNIHVNVMLDSADAEQSVRSEACLDELFNGVLAMGGAITGEHGIGLAKKPWWKPALSAEARHLHQRIKAALDPSHILNPGKFLDSSP